MATISTSYALAFRRPGSVISLQAQATKRPLIFFTEIPTFSNCEGSLYTCCLYVLLLFDHTPPPPPLPLSLPSLSTPFPGLDHSVVQSFVFSVLTMAEESWKTSSNWRATARNLSSHYQEGGAFLDSTDTRQSSRRGSNYGQASWRHGEKYIDEHLRSEKASASAKSKFRSGTEHPRNAASSKSREKSWHKKLRPNLVSSETLDRAAAVESSSSHIPLDDPETAAAIMEKRRIYVGNLLYSAKPEDIENLLGACGLPYERIHISIDPFTGRNPSYCFIEFESKAVADQAINLLSGQLLLGREVKCGPCEPKSRPDRDETFRRWGDWTGPNPLPAAKSSPGDRDFEIVEDGGASLSSPQANTSSGGPYEALKHWEGMANAKRRLYVGGLPRMADQRTCDSAVRKLFEGFDVEAVSKAISPNNKENREKGTRGPVNSYYCFVDFPTPGEAQRAADAMNGKKAYGGRLRVAHAKGDSSKWREREQFPGWDGGKAIDDIQIQDYETDYAR